MNELNLNTTAIKENDSIKLNKSSKSLFIYFIILCLLTTLRIIINGIDFNLSDNSLNLVFTLISQIFIMGIIPIAFYAIACYDKNINNMQSTLNDFGFKFKLPLNVYVLIIASGAIFFHMTIGISVLSNMLITAFGFTNQVYAPTIYKNEASLILNIFLVAILPGIFEEITHRGLVFNAFRKYGDRTAVYMSAMLFALMHQNISQFFYAYICGYMLAMLRLKTGSIIPPIIVHFANNFLSLMFDYSSQKGGFLDDIYTSLYGNADATTILFLMASWILAIYGVRAIINYLGVKTEIYPHKKLTANTKNKLNIASEPFLVAIGFLGVTTTLFTYIWGVIR